MKPAPGFIKISSVNRQLSISLNVEAEYLDLGGHEEAHYPDHHCLSLSLQSQALRHMVEPYCKTATALPKDECLFLISPIRINVFKQTCVRDKHQASASTSQS